jgi:hypothetical protein
MTITMTIRISRIHPDLVLKLQISYSIVIQRAMAHIFLKIHLIKIVIFSQDGGTHKLPTERFLRNKDAENLEKIIKRRRRFGFTTLDLLYNIF